MTRIAVFGGTGYLDIDAFAEAEDGQGLGLLENLAQSNDSLVLYMSSNNLNAICENLVEAGKGEKTPIAVIEQATTKYQQTYVSSIGEFEKTV